MRNYTEKQLSDLIYELLEDLKYEQTLSYPTTESVFPCIELHNPLKNVIKNYDTFPIKTMFQVSITCYNEEQRACMDMINEVEEILRKYNLVRANTSQAIFDQIIKKYGITVTFEVYYNAITDSFEKVR